MYLWLITQVEYEDMWKTKTGETRGKKTRTLEDEKEEPFDEEEHEETLDKEERREDTECCLEVVAQLFLEKASPTRVPRSNGTCDTMQR